ncbi:MAG: AraC family transcriptional regulator ligand-binding domain-containing protein, partial [Pseudomonadota bacterium]
MTARPRVLLDPATLTALRVPAGYVRQAVGFFAKTDEARAGLMATAGVAPTALDAADGTMSLADELALVGALNTRIGRHWAVEALPIWAPASQGALDLAARSAATIGEGLALAAQYAPARAPQFAATFDTATDPAALTIALRVAVDAGVGAAMCEAATLSAVAMIASLADGPLTILAYDWPWGPPAHAEALRQAAPGTHRFNAATCTLHVPHAIADQPSPHRDAGLLAATIAN